MQSSPTNTVLRVIAIFQIIRTDGFILNLGVTFNFMISATWLRPNGAGALVLGFNILALAALILLLKYRSALQAVKTDLLIQENVN